VLFRFDRQLDDESQRIRRGEETNSRRVEWQYWTTVIACRLLGLVAGAQ
jgi:hypothetical protein